MKLTDNQYITTKNRVPKDYFIAAGSGESNISIHSGSFHLALREAGIERYNIMQYSSVLPKIAREISKPDNLRHGEVMETIMAVAETDSGKPVAAGIAYAWLFDRKTGEKYGGLVCEQAGEYTENQLVSLLNSSILEIYHNGFSEQYRLEKPQLVSRFFKPTKKFASAIVAICFVNSVWEIDLNS